MRGRILAALMVAILGLFLAACSGERSSSVATRGASESNIVAFRFTVSARGIDTVPTGTSKVEVEFQNENNVSIDTQSKDFKTELEFISPFGSRFCKLSLKDQNGVCTHTETFPLVFINGRAEFINPRLERFNAPFAVSSLEFHDVPENIVLGQPVQFKVVDPTTGVEVTELVQFRSDNGAFAFDPDTPGLATPVLISQNNSVSCSLRKPSAELAVLSPDGKTVTTYDPLGLEDGRLAKLFLDPEKAEKEEERREIAQLVFARAILEQLGEAPTDIRVQNIARLIAIGEDDLTTQLRLDLLDNDGVFSTSSDSPLVRFLGRLDVQGEGLGDVTVARYNDDQNDDLIVTTGADRVLVVDLSKSVEVLVEFETPEPIASIVPAYPDNHGARADGVYISTTDSDQVKKYDANGNVVESLQAPSNGCHLESNIVDGTVYLTMSAIVPGSPPQNRLVTGALETGATNAFNSPRYKLICDSTFSPPAAPNIGLQGYQGTFVLGDPAQPNGSFVGMPIGQWNLADPANFFYFFDYGVCNNPDPPVLRGPGLSASGAMGRLSLPARSVERGVLEASVTVDISNSGTGTSGTTSGGTTIVGTSGTTGGTGGTGTTTGGSGSTTGGSGSTSTSGGTGGTGGMPPPPIGYTVGPATSGLIPLSPSEVIDPDVAIEDDFYVVVGNRIGGPEGDHIVCRQFEGAFGALTPIPIPYQLSGEFQASVPNPSTPAFSPAVAMDDSRNFVIGFLLDVSAAIDIIGRTFVPNAINPTGAPPAVSLVSAQNSEFFDFPRLDAAKAGVAGGDLTVLSSLQGMNLSSEIFQLPSLALIDSQRPVQIASILSSGQTTADVGVAPGGTSSVLAFSTTSGNVAGRLMVHSGGVNTLSALGEFTVFAGAGTAKNVSVDFISEDTFIVVYDVEMTGDSVIQGRIYQVVGGSPTLLEAATLVNDATGSDSDPDVASSPQDNAFWVTWTRDVEGQTEVYGRIFDDELQPRIGADFRFSDGQGAPGTATSSAVAMNEAGDTVVVWEADSTPPLDTGRAVYLRLAERQ